MKLHTVIILLENAYMEYTCIDPWLPDLKRHWVYRQTVSFDQICLQ